MHLRLAQLDSLISSSHIAAAQNCWHEVFDVGTCADTPTMSPPGSTPSSPRVSVSTPGMSGGSHTFLSGGMHAGGEGQGGAGGGLSSGLVTLPKPPESISSLQNPDKFSFLSIPYQPEFQPLEVSDIQCLCLTCLTLCVRCLHVLHLSDTWRLICVRSRTKEMCRDRSPT